MATTNDDNPSCISFLGYARYRELIMREKQDAEKDNRVSAKHSALAHWRVLVIVATPDLPQGGSGDQKPPKRRPWRGTPLGVQRRRISDEEADVRGETRRVRAPAGRGRHELHPGRARGRRLETHRQGVAQREPRHRDHEPCRARQKAADRLKRPKPRKAAEDCGTRSSPGCAGIGARSR